jgi:polyphosphate kinase
MPSTLSSGTEAGTASGSLDFSRPELYSHRELSWLEFNHRVLEEAQDPANPLLERVKFLCITSSNLDEFFEIRISGLKQQIENNVIDPGPDGLSAAQVFPKIEARIRRMVADQYRLWNEELVPALSAANIHFHRVEELREADFDWARDYFEREIFPVLTPLAVDPSHPFPQLLNKSLNIIVVLHRPGSLEEARYAIVQVPRVLNRLIRIPHLGGHHFVFLSNLIDCFIESLFPGVKASGAYAFRVTRNSDLYIDDEEAQNLLRTIEEELRNRNKGNAVRLEMEDGCPAEVQNYLLEKFDLQHGDLYLANGPLNLLRLMPLAELDAGNPQLSRKSFTPVVAPALRVDQPIFDILRHQDVLLHHPYESFNSIIEFLECSARDPRVLAIKMTLYRTSGDSAVVKALIDAAHNGKQVTVLVELKARFDEANNIAWARKMEEAGIHVVYGMVGLKTHCKIMLVVRREEDRIRYYAHLGTGNYHPKTARLYTDLGLLTTDATLTQEVLVLFNCLTGMSDYPELKKLLVAPFALAQGILSLIRGETARALAGEKASIFAKMNSLVDQEVIAALYEASCAGVQIDLLVRGICCLRPGIPGVSENIRVTSIVDQFLEHSRIFHFENGGDPLVYLGSADLMPRNLYRRVEVVFPVEDPRLRAHIIDNIIATYLRDNVKARILQPDGSHIRRSRGEGEQMVSAQETFKTEALAP